MIINPFSDKRVEGKSLFARVHGIDPVSIPAGEEHTFSFSVPYPHCKITCVEIVEDVISKSSLTVDHPQLGVLNQFGFNVNVGSKVYLRSSPYDADLFQGLILKVKVENITDSPKVYGINLILHEVKE